MTSPSLSVVWFQLLALLAIEVSLIALAVALLWRRSSSAAWRRTFCQIGIIAALGVTACELSGSARSLAGWPARIFATRASVTGINQADRVSLPDTSIIRELSARGAAADVSAVENAETHLHKVQEVCTGSVSAQVVSAMHVEKFGEAHQETQSSKPAKAVERWEPAAFSPDPSVEAGRGSEGTVDLLCFLWLGLGWGIGAMLAAARVCLAHCLFALYRLRRNPITDRVVLRRTEELARAVGISRRIRIIESGQLASPIAYGLVRPTVGLPPDFGARFDGPRQGAMLVHELAHLAAHDPLWCLLADLATIPLWWHPAVWWLRRRLHLASEMAADEASLLVTDGPRVLAECLVELGSRLAQPAPLGHLRVSGFRSHLGRRVQQLVHLEGRSWSPPSRLRAALLTIFGPMALVAIVVLCTAWAPPLPVTNGDSMNATKLNWKRSLAALALLTAANGPVATSVMAQSDQVASPPPAAPPAQSAAAPAAPPPGTPAAANQVEPPAGPAAAKPDDATAAAEAFRRRYGLPATTPAPVPVRPAANPAQEAPAKRGARLEARLKQILLPEIIFEGSPLGEVLRVLSEESIKRDPQKTGVNFLINPNVPPMAPAGTIDPATGLPLPPSPSRYGVPAGQYQVDPATGLPVVATADTFDMSGVMIQFNLPLRNVSMKDVLDAIVTVADHPIEYTLEDYAVVFSARPQMVASQPMVTAQALAAPQSQFIQPISPRTGLPVSPQQNPFVQTAEAPGHHALTAEALAAIKPQTFNIDFGSGAPSKQVGAAAAGHAGDFWNTVSVGFNDHHTETDLKFAGGDWSPIEVEMINLGGGWSFHGQMGVKSPMLDTYNYPTGNRGGNSQVILHQVPPGQYSLYLYGHGPNGPYYGDYTVTVGSRNYGRKQTTYGDDAGRNTKWVEGSQYVRFSGVKVGLGEDVQILIQPGGQVSDFPGRTFSDAIICGLQLIPAK
jgi:beta-lactamase regulating signal transducer with metallopeptidase domain